jgi:GNAT superfamily N-acetyltransferase
MRLQEFHLELFERPSAAQQAELRELWQEALATTGPADAGALADLETAGWHVLARDPGDHALGCGSLGSGGRIGCIAVREAARGQGVGTAILHELIARARALGLTALSADVPTAVMGFFAHAGFAASTAEADDGVIVRCTLSVPSLAQAGGERPPLRDIGALPAGSQVEVAAARLQLLADTRHQLLIYLPSLHAGIFATPAELEQLRRIACSGRAASIRILLHDPAAAVAIDHPLLPLAQRLTSAFQFRTPTDPVDLTYTSAYLLTDTGGYLFLPDASRPAGRAARTQRSAQVPLRQHFGAGWERAERATILNALDL